MRKILKAFMTDPFQRRRGQPYTPPADPEFWRSPEATPIKKRRIEDRWGLKTVPTVLIYDLAPLKRVNPDDEVEIAQKFYEKPQYPAGAIMFRDSKTSEPPMVYLFVKYATVLHLEFELQGHRLPLFKASYGQPGRSGTVIEFKDLRPDTPEASRKSS